MSRRYALAILSSLLFFGAFPPLDVGLFAWVALVPLLLAIRELPPRQAFGLGYVAGFVAFFGVLAWIRVFGLPAWVLLAAYLALYVGAFCGLYRWAAAGRSPAVGIWLVPVIWVGLEYVRSVGPTGFPWATLGTAQHAYLPVIQVASVAGVFGVSFVVALSNAVLTGIRGRWILPVLAPALLVVAVVGWGMQHARPVAPGPLVAVAVQPNVPQREKFAPAFAARNLEGLERLVREAARDHPELIVFPETALPGNLFGEGGLLPRMGEWARDSRATLLVSSLEDGVSNIAVTVAPSGQPLSRYDKVRLVAFGEAGIRPGTRHDPLEAPGGPLGVAICFESIFPDVTRELVRNGAEVLAIITNDAWFDGTSGPAQHAAHAALRAVETGRWILRATNTGISMVVTPVGAVEAVAPIQQQTVLSAHVAPIGTMTFYAQWGDLFAQVVVVSFVLLAAPRLWATLVSEWRSSAFHHVLVAVLLPLLTVWSVLQRGSVAWAWPAVLLAFLVTLAFQHPPADWGLQRAHGFAAAGGGLAIVLGLWALLAVAYRAQGVPITWTQPLSAWAAAAVRQVIVAGILESWLRGIAFASVAEWKGWPTAVVATTLLGMAIQTGLPAEAVVWAGLTGAVFGVIRARTGNVSGLVLPHALGNMLLGFVVAVR